MPRVSLRFHPAASVEYADALAHRLDALIKESELIEDDLEQEPMVFTDHALQCHPQLGDLPPQAPAGQLGELFGRVLARREPLEDLSPTLVWIGRSGYVPERA